MDRISLYENNDTGSTRVSNCFIDHFMTNANEAQIKIYLYLLRSVSSGADIAVSDIADRFNYTERDILRALIYWDRHGLISLDFDDNRNVRGICLNNAERSVPQGSVSPVSGILPGGTLHEEPVSVAAPAPAFSGEALPMAAPGRILPAETAPAPAFPEENAPEKAVSPARPFYSSGQIRDFRENAGVRDLLFTTEQYLKRSLSSSDLSSILYIYDSLHFDADFICYLVEYCVNSGHRNMHYIESVALDWNERGIRSIEDAKRDNEYRREYYDVLKAFGLSGRNPVKSDIDHIRRWKDEYGFSQELIIEAVNRTMSSISKPSFQYADSILRSWRDRKVSSIADIEAGDRSHNAVRKDSGRGPLKVHNFKERDYDFSELEKKFARN